MLENMEMELSEKEYGEVSGELGRLRGLRGKTKNPLHLRMLESQMKPLKDKLNNAHKARNFRESRYQVQ